MNDLAIVYEDYDSTSLYDSTENLETDSNPFASDVSTSIENYNKTLEKHNTILGRIVGVSDIVLKEQLQQEYSRYYENLELAEIAVKTSNMNYIKFMSIGWLAELRSIYLMGTVQVDFIEALLFNGIDIVALCNKLKCRPINNTQQKRELTLLLNNLDLQLHIIDLEFITIDRMGIGSNIIRLRRPCFSRVKECDTNNSFLILK
jgi:hypothetical protein